MKPRKPKGMEPSLSQKAMAALDEDFKTHGVDAIKQLRESRPDRYVELCTRGTEPSVDGIESAQSKQELAVRLLKSIGMGEFEMTQEMIDQAIAAKDAFVARLREIRNAAEPLQ
jgi:hypothetical protein